MALLGRGKADVGSASLAGALAHVLRMLRADCLQQMTFVPFNI